MTLQAVVFRATLTDPSARATHDRMVVEMRDLARGIDGFVEWRDAMDDLTYWGYVIFESEEAALAWKGDPRHKAIHEHGELVYTEFATHAFASVRNASWRRDPNAPDRNAAS
jgi:heme-degrading monooxygenase HmoA